MSRWQVLIEPGAFRFAASSQLPLLQSAAAAGLRLASSCRNGTCRTCMCRLRSGQVHYRIEWPGLSAEEKQEGYILPCVAYPDADLVIEDSRALRDGTTSAHDGIMPDRNPTTG